MSYKVWFCGDRDGDSDGHVLFASNEYPELATVDDSEYCPRCSFPKGYHGCEWAEFHPIGTQGELESLRLVAVLYEESVDAKVGWYSPAEIDG